MFFKRIFKHSTLKTLSNMFIYDNWFKDFFLGFVFQKLQSNRISILQKKVSLKINDSSDLMTINEIFNWKIYQTNRMSEYKYLFDLGANIGCASVYFGHACPALKKVYCFEPDERVHLDLEDNLKNNLSHLDINLSKTAVTQNGEPVQINLTSSSRYNSIDDNSRFKFIDKVLVQSTSFHTLIKNICSHDPKEVIIKIDIEGMENSLFKAIQDYGYIGDIVVEGEGFSSNMIGYSMKWNKFNDVYYFSQKD